MSITTLQGQARYKKNRIISTFYIGTALAIIYYIRDGQLLHFII